MRDCRIQHEARDDLDILHLEGALDFRTFPRLDAATKDLMESGRYRIVYDCRDLNYVSSAALGSLIAFSRQARKHGGDLKLGAVPEDIITIITLLGFDKVLDIHPDAETAVLAFSK